jgi:hypothetical protein
VDGRRRASEIINLIDLDEERVGDVVTEKLEPLVVEQMLDITTGASKEVVDAENLETSLKELLGKMRPEKARTAGDQDPSLKMHDALQLRSAHR